MALVTGASGTASKVLRMPPFDRVDAPAEVDLERLGGRAFEVGDEVGQLVGGGAQVDRPFQWVVEQRRVAETLP